MSQLCNYKMDHNVYLFLHTAEMHSCTEQVVFNFGSFNVLCIVFHEFTHLHQHACLPWNLANSAKNSWTNHLRSAFVLVNKEQLLTQKKLLGKKHSASPEWNLFWDLNTTHYSKHLNEWESSMEIPSWPNFTWNLIAFWLQLPMLMMSARRDLPSFLSRQEKQNYLVNQRQILACWLEEDNVITLLPQQKQECTWASKTEVPCSSSSSSCSSVHKIHFTTYKVVQIHLPSSKETNWLLIQS